MNTEIVVYKFKHYEMDGNKGLSVLVNGDVVEDNNQTGVQITESKVPYIELEYLKTIPANSFPAKFKAQMDFTAVKNRTGKEQTGIQFSHLTFICPMKLIEVKKS